jgi:mono/diheme cytochrome c family protein
MNENYERLLEAVESCEAQLVPEGVLMKTVVVAVFMALGLASAANAQDKPEFDGAKAIRGEASYRTYCGSCHGKDAKGDGPLAKMLRVPPSDLTQLSSKNQGEFPYEEVLETIEKGSKVRGHGSSDMPAWGTDFLQTDTKAEARERMMNLVQYIWSLNR